METTSGQLVLQVSGLDGTAHRNTEVMMSVALQRQCSREGLLGRHRADPLGRPAAVATCRSLLAVRLVLQAGT